MRTVQKSVVAIGHERIVNNEPKHFSDANFPVGTTSHQGDWTVARLSKLPKVVEEQTDRQLSPGTTQGSRHVMLDDGTKLYRCDGDSVAKQIAKDFHGTTIDPKYFGPVFVVKGCGTLTHPEHGWHHYEGDMIIATIGQRSLDAEERERRTLD